MTKNECNNEMLVFFDKNYEDNECLKIAQNLEFISLGNFVGSWLLIYETKDYINQQEEWIKIAKKECNSLTPWCLKITINKYILINKNITLDYIVSQIDDEKLFIITKENESDEITLRIYFTFDISENINESINYILNKQVGGIKNILSSQLVEVVRHVKESDGSLIEKKK